MRVCGLKPMPNHQRLIMHNSHPMRVCGLKLGQLGVFRQTWFTPHAGVWIETIPFAFALRATRFTPHAGVWIETHLSLGQHNRFHSHHMRVCGLKLSKLLKKMFQQASHPMRVCGLKLCLFLNSHSYICSHPMRVCGLKLAKSLTMHRN